MLARDVHPIVTRPRSQAERDTIQAAAAAAGVTMSAYVLRCALAVAKREGFEAADAKAPWRPRMRRKPAA